MEDFAYAYALAKKVPDMKHRGFTIETAYGEISVDPGRLADLVAGIVEAHLLVELKKLRLEEVNAAAEIATAVLARADQALKVAA